MTETSGGEPAIAEVLTAINGLKVNGPEPVRALREDVLALGNRTQRLIDGLRGDMDQRFGLLMDAIVDLRAGLEARSRAIRDAQDRSSPSDRPASIASTRQSAWASTASKTIQEVPDHGIPRQHDHPRSGRNAGRSGPGHPRPRGRPFARARGPGTPAAPVAPAAAPRRMAHPRAVRRRRRRPARGGPRLDAAAGVAHR